ncbi:MAG: carboxymuconolactone decarboxylase family protein, partial [Polynucleobacter victoriensis]
AGGTEAQVNALRSLGQQLMLQGLFTPLEQDALDLTIQMTKSIEVDRSLMKRLQEQLGNTRLVELVGVIATYNMVSRFLVALDVTPDGH